MRKLASTLVIALSSIAAQPAEAQSSEQKIWMNPRILTPPRKAQQPLPPSSEVEVSKFDGAGNVNVDAATFDQFAQMVRRFNSLERKVDELSKQNLELSRQLANALNAINETHEALLAHAKLTGTTPKGMTVGAAVGLTCSIVSELLYIEKGSFLGFNPPEGGNPRPC